MNIFDEYTYKLLSELNKNNVEYIVVGGYAVNFYGYRRTTGDIDLWIKPDNGENKKMILKTLRNLQIEENVLREIEKLDFTKPTVFIDGEEPFKIDFMTYISNVKFDEAFKQKKIAHFDGLEIPFLHLNHLILSKMTTGRGKDKDDIEKLQRIDKLKKK